MELILNEQPNEESSLQATSETKENQQQVRTSKRRKVKEEPTPVQLIKVATNEKKIIEVPEIKPEIRISVKKSPVKEPVIQEIISKKTEEVICFNLSKF